MEDILPEQELSPAQIMDERVKIVQEQHIYLAKTIDRLDKENRDMKKENQDMKKIVTEMYELLVMIDNESDESDVDLYYTSDDEKKDYKKVVRKVVKDEINVVKDEVKDEVVMTL